MATKKFSDYAIQGNNVTLTYDNVNDTVTFDVNIDKNDVGLGNVDNTSDANKPISTATQTALNSKQDSLGFTPVTNARTLTINGTTFDLSANRTWSVGDLVSSGSYSNPTWLTSLAWGKLTGTPTTLSGYGITDAVPSNRTLTINGTAYDLSADRSWTISFATPTLAQVTTAGNTTTNAISVGKITVNALSDGYESAKFKSFANTYHNLISFYLSDDTTSTVVLGRNGASVSYPYKTGMLANYGFVGNNYSGMHLFAGSNIAQTIHSTGNVGINTTTDAGYKLDVNGTLRVSGSLAASGGITCSTFPYGDGNGNTKSFSTQGVLSGNKIIFQDINAYTGTSNLIHIIVSNTSFAPTNGSGRFSGIELIHTINQTGGANGITRGIYINPTLTAAADFRAIDIQTGSLVLGRMTSDPTIATNGMIYYNTTTQKFRGYENGAWTNLI